MDILVLYIEVGTYEKNDDSFYISYIDRLFDLL